MNKMRSFICRAVGFGTVVSVICFNTNTALNPKLSSTTIAATPAKTLAQNTSQCSKEGNRQARITFINDTNRQVDIYWVNYQCEEVKYYTLRPGQSYRQRTYITHPWRVRDSQTGRILNEAVTRRGNSQFRVSSSQTPPNSQPTNSNNTVTANNQQECNGQQIVTSRSCVGDGLDSEEQRLYNLVNQYRAQNGLPAIPFSSSLTLVANRHVQDLQKNIKTLTHGWSNCPYNASNRATYDCMWKAPQRFGTPYPGNGYENAHGGSGGYKASANSALESWKTSSAHNAVILNQGMWQNRPWQALGIGIYGGYAVLWFGEEVDPAASSQ
ncbi:CAP domain-containing protein [Anabaena sp. UHCC 0451]|uniref:VHL beta domain-containing protein n=1 Tax=Anabaena sp. UHCC 0451 TaxID=2055235 RepID=UPI002B214987|nr:CAP domain-containing protein [Anabaena sp. UHCC 0451]MEA5578698.1 CAP domain-containing protein [Anabaena sp. UHCC 0451]